MQCGKCNGCLMEGKITKLQLLSGQGFQEILHDVFSNIRTLVLVVVSNGKRNSQHRPFLPPPIFAAFGWLLLVGSWNWLENSPSSIKRHDCKSVQIELHLLFKPNGSEIALKTVLLARGPLTHWPKNSISLHIICYGSRAGRRRSAEWSLGFTSPPRIASRFCMCGYFALLPNPALSRIPVQSVSMRGHGTMQCWRPAGHRDPHWTGRGKTK